MLNTTRRIKMMLKVYNWVCACSIVIPVLFPWHTPANNNHRIVTIIKFLVIGIEEAIYVRSTSNKTAVIKKQLTVVDVGNGEVQSVLTIKI